MKWDKKVGIVKYLKNWHPWFAWKPVPISKMSENGIVKIAWLETVLRKGCVIEKVGYNWEWVYKEKPPCNGGMET